MLAHRRVVGPGASVWTRAFLIVLFLGGWSARAPAQDSTRTPVEPEITADWLERATEDIRRSEYRFVTAVDGARVAPNRAHGLRSRVSPRGLQVWPREMEADGVGAAWSVSLRTVSYGRLGEAWALAGATLAQDGERVTLDHGRLVEWFVNDERGIEQGWTLPVRPLGDPAQPVWIGLAVGGDLGLRIDADGRSAWLVDAAGAARLHVHGLRAWDATGAELDARLASGPDGPGVRVDDARATYPVTVDPIIASGVWFVEGDADSLRLGHSVATAGDVNADGYSDVIVGAPSYANGEGSEGAAFVYLGSATGLPTSPDWSWEPDQVNAQFGQSVATAGDVDGDGYGDLIVGAQGYTVSESFEGAAFVFLGSASGPGASPAWTFAGGQGNALLGASVATAGDVNGDGYSDVIVGAPYHTDVEQLEGRAYVILGSATGLSATPAWTGQGYQEFANYGQSVASAGDVNGDGYDDVVVGAPSFSVSAPFSQEGRVSVYLGRPGGVHTFPAWVRSGPHSYALYGTSVGTAGDVDGDGLSDVIVGATNYTNGEASEGAAFVYTGHAGGLDVLPHATLEADWVGASLGIVTTAGDVNGDGFSDVLVGAPYWTNGESGEGATMLYLGSADGLETTPVRQVEGGVLSAQLGAALATAGDVDGDGFGDLIVSAPWYTNDQTNEGRVYVFFGDSDFTDVDDSWTVAGTQLHEQFGASLATAGDVNGDGFSDVIVGAWRYDDGTGEVGRTSLFEGGTDGLATTPSWTADGETPNSRFGLAVSGAGDVNGDGYDDVIVGSESFHASGTVGGAAYAFHGSGAGLSATPDWTRYGDTFGDSFGHSVSSAGDVNGDGYGDVIVSAINYSNVETTEGAAYVFEGSAAGLATAAAWQVESDQNVANFGASVSTAGDVNGDGFDDVIVGADNYTNGETFEGRAYIWYGSFSGLADAPGWTTEPDQASASYGESVASAGDVNGDGFSDVVVGAPAFASSGKVYVFYGSSSGPATTADWTDAGPGGTVRFGNSVASAGDVDGDGYADVIIGAEWYANGEAQEGAAFLYRGLGSGLQTTSPWSFESDKMFARAGSCVATAGDVNGDGYADVLVGARTYDVAFGDDGRAWLFLGNRSGGTAAGISQLRSDGAAPLALHGRSEAVDSFRIRARFDRGLVPFDWAWPHPVTAHLEWEVEELGTPFDGVGIERSATGQVVGPPGTTITFEELVEGLEPAQRYCWRARFVTDHPLFPVTNWFTLPWNGMDEAKLRTLGPDGLPLGRLGTRTDPDLRGLPP